jgi:hypothetical protein
MWLQNVSNTNTAMPAAGMVLLPLLNSQYLVMAFQHQLLIITTAICCCTTVMVPSLPAQQPCLCCAKVAL